MAQERFVAVALLTQRDVDLLGSTLRTVWQIEEAPCFSGLLEAIDRADRDYWRGQDGGE